MIVEALTVNVIRSIYFHSVLGGKLLKNLTYLAFANAETGYLVHKLVQPPDLAKAAKPPDFVQILSAEIEGEKAAKLRKVREISFPGTVNDQAHKLQASEDKAGKSQARLYTCVPAPN